LPCPHKGAGARKGNKIPYAGFAGGQAPLYRRIPKRGFTNARFKREFAELNLDTLAHMIRTNRLRVDPEREIGLKELSDCGAVSIAACARAPSAARGIIARCSAAARTSPTSRVRSTRRTAQAPCGRQAARHRRRRLRRAH